MKDLLSLPKRERELLSGKREDLPSQKANADKEQIPLPFGEKALVKPAAYCDSCGWAMGDVPHAKIVSCRVYGCPECGGDVRVVDLWE